MIKKHFELVDFLKGYSIFTIVIYHFLLLYNLPYLLEKAINFGGAGVHVFILCSGFGLYLSHLYRPLKYWTFIKRRFFKIYIPYILVIFISVLVPFIYIENDKFLALLSSVFLYKMFDEHFINSFGGQLWFISMIIQFYLVFPLLTKWIDSSKVVSHIIITLLISLGWATLVGILGKTDLRVWNSFFLQYLWEFVLGMELAKYYFKNQNVELPSRFFLIIISIIGIVLVGYTGIKGGIYKLYNDVPSLFGYLSLSLLIYSFSIKQINSFFLYTNKFAYEWYLIHILVFSCTFHFLSNYFQPVLTGLIGLFLSYILAIGYHRLLKYILFVKEPLAPSES